MSSQTKGQTMSKKDPYEKDAFWQLDQLIEANTLLTEFRPDITVSAAAHERCIYINDVSHNVGTIIDLIEVLEEAVSFVIDRNPKWGVGIYYRK